MQVKTIPLKKVHVPENRQRKEFDENYIADLATSIERNGLINLPVIKDGSTLIAGECRLKAIEWLWGMGGKLRYGGQTLAEGMVPFQDLQDLDPVDAYEIELEENIRRKDLTWQEQAAATAQLFELRRLQAQKKGATLPTVTEIAKEIRGDSGGAFERTRAELLVSRHLNNPEVAKAKTAKDALKVLQRQEELRKSAELGERVGQTFSAQDHTLLNCDALQWLVSCPSEQFDCILTDPIYGIDADEFNDSGGAVGGGGTHFYDDSYDLWKSHMAILSREGFRITKPLAHLYAFCDVDRFCEMKAIFSEQGWKVFRTPFIWHNPTSNRAPWPTQGPHRKYQLILYAVKGNKNVKILRPDVLVHPSDPNLNHHAQKPVALYAELLARSCAPGDSVVDCFCGSGTIFPAAHAAKIKATGIELDKSAYGIAVERLSQLK
jgi:site-specific DNA-methyltransferase (adenine-specific)